MEPATNVTAPDCTPGTHTSVPWDPGSHALLRSLFVSAAVWTGLGLLSGLYYREFTKFHGVPGGTQLALVHTHALTLGTMVLLMLLALVAAVPGLSQRKAFRRGIVVYQVGLALTFVGLLVKGTLQVMAAAAASSPAIAGVSGLGHMTLTVAFVTLFLGLGRVLKAARVLAVSRRA